MYSCKSTGKFNQPEHQSNWFSTKQEAINDYRKKYPNDDMNDTTILSEPM